MLTSLAIFAAIISIIMMAAVLIQNPKGGGIDQTFGGQAQQLFGAARSTDFIEKATWVLAGTLILFCIIAVFIVQSGATGVEGELPLQSLPTGG